MSDRERDHEAKFVWEAGDVEVSDPPQCSACRHYRGGITCDAYPELIPPEIFVGDVDHRAPYPGDHGIQFAPRDE